jgi:hypothetical protein
VPSFRNLDGTWLELLKPPELIGMVTSQEHEVAVAAHFMGYDLMRGPDGYTLSRRYGADYEVVKAPTLAEITKHLKH